MEGQTGGTRALIVSLIVYFVVLALQLSTYFMTGILALFAAAMDTLSSAFIAAFLLFAVYRSRKPPDESFMFGYGRAQNVAALVSATIFIAFMSIEVFREAIPKFFRMEAGGFQNITFALVASAIAVILVAIPILDILRSKVSGAAIKTQLVSLLIDETSYIAALVAVILVDRGWYLADPIASTVVGLAIAFGGFRIFRENALYLVGKAPGKELLERITLAARSVDGVLGVHALKAEYVGPGVLHTGFHIEVARGTPVEEADRIAHEIEASVGRETGCQHCVIHIDPEKAYPAVRHPAS